MRGCYQLMWEMQFSKSEKSTLRNLRKYSSEKGYRWDGVLEVQGMHPHPPNLGCQLPANANVLARSTTYWADHLLELNSGCKIIYKKCGSACLHMMYVQIWLDLNAHTLDYSFIMFSILIEYEQVCMKSLDIFSPTVCTFKDTKQICAYS